MIGCFGEGMKNLIEDAKILCRNEKQLEQMTSEMENFKDLQI